MSSNNVVSLEDARRAREEKLEAELYAIADNAVDKPSANAIRSLLRIKKLLENLPK